MEQVTQAKREIYAEWLRIVAAFAVVFQHTVTSIWYDTPVSSEDFIALNFMNSLSRFGVGVFIMISGAFMLSPKYPHKPEKILKHNLPRVLIPLVFWVTVYGVVNAVTEAVKAGTPIGENIAALLTAPLDLFTEPATHLWFLYTIAGLYVITPAIRVFTEHASKRMVLYVIALFFFFGLVLPTTSHILDKVFDFTLYRNIRIRGTTSFAGFYLTGFYIAQYGIPRIARRVLYVAAFLSWFLAFFYSTYFSLVRAAPNEFFFGNFRPTTFLVAAGIFCLFREKFRDRTTNGKALVAISGCMLGVYLVHPLFIKASYGLGFTPVDPNPLITSPIMAVIFFTLSLGVVFAARQIPGLKKIL